MKSKTRFGKHPRRGLASVAVVVCLIVITLICAALLKFGLAQRKLSGVEERRLQCEWLVESGLDRALARLSRDRNYSGEEWPILARDLSLSVPVAKDGPSDAAARRAALITITVDRPEKNANRRRIRVRADYPLDPPARLRQTKDLLIEFEPTKAGVAS
jgi:hypothetical protein